jgi:hypothetical protein
MRLLATLFLACITVTLLSYKSLTPLEYFDQRLVRRWHSPDKKQTVARKLKEVEVILHDLLARGPRECPKFNRIRRRWNGKLFETSSEDHPDDALAYSIDKGAAIHICVLDENGNVAETNAMVFVAIHELAHVAEKLYGHGPSFYETMRYLLEIADGLGVYSYENHETSFVSLCGRRLGHNPLSCVKNGQCKSLVS